MVTIERLRDVINSDPVHVHQREYHVTGIPENIRQYEQYAQVERVDD